jgi:stage V sporulation protein AB
MVALGFGSGAVISGAVFAFISVIGVIPRFAQKTGTQGYVVLYENAIIAGGIFGSTTMFIDYRLHVGAVVAAALSLCLGIFYGCLAVSLAEVLDVIPILTRRGKVERGMFYFILALALGKLAGSLVYFLISGFYEGG